MSVTMSQPQQCDLNWWKGFVEEHGFKQAALIAHEPFPDGSVLYTLKLFYGAGYGAVNNTTFEIMRTIKSVELYGGFNKADCDRLLTVAHQAIAAVWPGENSSLKRRHLDYAAK